MNTYEYPVRLAAEAPRERLRVVEGAIPFAVRLERIRRWLPYLAIWLAACVGGALFYCLFAPQGFLVTAQVVLEPRQPVASTDSAAQVGATTLDSALADSQVQMLQSERNLRYVFDVQKLADDPEFKDSGDSWSALLLGRIPFLKSPQLSPEEAAPRARETAFQNFASRVSAKRLAQSYAFELSFYADGAQKAARIGNAIAAAYIRDKMLYNIAASAAQRGGDFLQNRIEDTRADRDAIEVAVRTGVIPSAVFGHADARIISTAAAPLKRAYPRTTLIVALAGALGLLIGLGALLVADDLDRSLGSRRRMTALTGVAAIAELPNVKGAHGRPSGLLHLARSDPGSRFCGEMRKLCVAAMESGDGKAPTVGVISGRRGEGATTVAANLADLLAGTVGPTVLVDGDFASCDVSRLLAPAALRGLAESLGEDPQAALIDLGGDVSLLASRVRADAPFVTFKVLAGAVATLARTHAVVVDLPSVEESAEGLALARSLTGVIVVADARSCRVEDLRVLLDRLAEADARVLGVALNKRA